MHARRRSLNCAGAGAPPLKIGAWLRPTANTLLDPHVCSNRLGVYGSQFFWGTPASESDPLETHFSTIGNPREKFDHPSRPAFQGHSRSAGTETDRSATYDFLLVTHIITMRLSRIVSEINGDFCQKLQNIPPPLYLTPPLREFPLEYCNGGSALETSHAPAR